MTTLKELKEHYYISNYKYEGKYLIYDKTPGSGQRSVYKYLCSAIKNKNSWIIENFKPVSKLNDIKDLINKHVSTYKYDSEYYQPQYRDGILEEYVIHDYLRELGFSISDNSFGSTTYTNENKNVYGKVNNIHLTFDGLSCFKDEISKIVKIIYTVDFGSWVSVEVNRDCESIIKGIDSILNPLLVTESVTNFTNSEKLHNKYTDIDLMISNLSSNLINVETNYKETLKEKLQTLINNL